MNRLRWKSPLLAGIVLILCPPVSAYDGYDLWLRYSRVEDPRLLADYRDVIPKVAVPGTSETLRMVRDELKRGLTGILGVEVPISAQPDPHAALTVARYPDPDSGLGDEGYRITSGMTSVGHLTKIRANTDIGLLYGTFHFLRLLQTNQPLERVYIRSRPAIRYRILDHWDNIDGSVERGYAGHSLWKWKELPGTIDPRYRDYARADASIGINGVVLNNVNANPVLLTGEYLRKVAALADVFRPAGIRVYLSANFASPLGGHFELEGNRRGGIGNLSTADPLDPEVRAWWKRKVADIYALIPDFGGFLIKASSEGMPGPNDYHRSHAEGANMLADVLAPFGGIVMWRAFVYTPAADTDRVKRSYKEFVPLDGEFRPNVFIQAKNGPLDFQPREPVQPLFGAMPKTPLMLELQVTQEYLGHSVHLVYLAPMWKEYLTFDTYARGPGSTLASVIDGTLYGRSMTGIAGVANVGDDRNWCGHFFAQANWFAFGRLAWDPSVSAGAIAEDWIRMSLTGDSAALRAIKGMMMGSWEACINYMTPLGLHHIMEVDVHYGPGPQNDQGRDDWRSTYYHRADTSGLGFDRSPTGSNAVAQYHSPLREEFGNVATCPEKYLLWFHHVGWRDTLHDGRTLWEEFCRSYFSGTSTVAGMTATWSSVKSNVDPEVFAAVRAKLQQQERDAGAWRDTCLGYFSRFSRMPVVQPASRR